MSYGSTYKQCDEPKVIKIKFEGENYAVMAIAGSLDGARCYQEILESKAATTRVEDARTVVNVSENALKEARKKLLGYLDDPLTTSAERQVHMEGHDFEVILAYYHADIPYIYTLKLYNGIAIKSRHTFEAIGCGSNIAGFILTGGDLKSCDLISAMATTAYVIESCKKFDQACGGEIQHMILSKAQDYCPYSLSNFLIQTYKDAVNRTDDKMHSLIVKTVTDEIESAARAAASGSSNQNAKTFFEKAKKFF